MKTQIAVNKTEIAIMKKTLEQLQKENRNDHLTLGNKIDKLTKQVTQLMERNNVEREKDKAVLSVRMWLIGVTTGIISFVITWVTHR